MKKLARYRRRSGKPQPHQTAVRVSWWAVSGSPGRGDAMDAEGTGCRKMARSAFGLQEEMNAVPEAR